MPGIRETYSSYYLNKEYLKATSINDIVLRYSTIMIFLSINTLS